MARISTERAVSCSGVLAGVVIVAAAAAVGACAPTLPPNNPIAIDDQYGIPAGSVPPNLLKPDGVMTNGLLPAQPYDTGG